MILWDKMAIRECPICGFKEGVIKIFVNLESNNIEIRGGTIIEKIKCLGCTSLSGIIDSNNYADNTGVR